MADVENYDLVLSETAAFSLADETEVENFVVNFDETEDLDVTFGDVINNGTEDFNSLYNRPSYNGETMTSDTDIPEVKEYEAGDGITIEGNVISAVPMTVDSEMSATSTNPVQNKVVYGVLVSKANSDDLAEVAFTGEYDDLENEPTDFTADEWSQLWANY